MSEEGREGERKDGARFLQGGFNGGNEAGRKRGKEKKVEEGRLDGGRK